MRIICYCSHGCVPRGVFVRILHKNPEFHNAKRRFFAVSVHREACYCSQHAAFWRGVNSNHNIGNRLFFKNIVMHIQVDLWYNL